MWGSDGLKVVMKDHVSFRVPRLIHRPMHRSMYRSIPNRLSTNMQPTCRSTLDRESTDILVELPLMSADVSSMTISVGYRPTTGGISVNYRPICRSIDAMVSVDISADTWPILTVDMHWSYEWNEEVIIAVVIAFRIPEGVFPSLVKETFTSRKGMLVEEWELVNFTVEGMLLR